MPDEQANKTAKEPQKNVGPSNAYNSAIKEDERYNVTVPSISMPKGGGAIKSIGEKFEVNAVNGTANFSVPLPTAAARDFAVGISISYNSGGGNSVFGMGWSLNLPSIRRKTEKELPKYMDALDSDIFIISGAEDLIPRLKENGGNWEADETDSPDGLFTIKYYRPRIEGGFARIEKWTEKSTGIAHWRAFSKDNIVTIYGDTPESRNADPADDTHIFEWFIRFTYDNKGNCVVYEYEPEDAIGIDALQLHNKNRVNGNTSFVNTYLKRMRAGNINPYLAGNAEPAAAQYVFETVLDYGEHDIAPPFNAVNQWTFRTDAFSNYRAGFEIRTCRLCKRALLYHHFAELPGGSALVRSLDFTYDDNGQNGNFTFLRQSVSTGYTRHADGSYTQKSLPPATFTYQQHQWNTDVKPVDRESLANAPAGILEPNYKWVDLYNEGLSGILTEEPGGLFYKRNLGNASFSPAVQVSPKPSVAGVDKEFRLVDLEADGTKYLSAYEGEVKGFYRLTDEEEWEPFRAFDQMPMIDFADPNTKLIDLDGDGRADVLITEDNVFTWYPSLGEKGFDEHRRTWQDYDEEKGPHIIFANGEQSVFLTDMSGDGLTDIVRIRNGYVCYWPNLGYGKFGAKVSMDNVPFFDNPEQFNASFLRLADIDGSGTTDIAYLGKNKISIWLNQSGNYFLPDPQVIEPFPANDHLSQVSVVDFLGNGTSCIVWSSPHLKDAGNPLQYIDLMNSRKPHIMTGFKNGMGKEVELEYTSSTRYYLDDKLAGTPWITKLPFPVYCLSKVTAYDRIQKTRLASEYTYHHGYYDHAEKEFRGFGRVDQQDAETITHFEKQSGGMNNVLPNDLQQPPVLVKTWFHTGAFLDREKIINQFAHEYSQNTQHPENLLPEPELPADLSIDEWRQALRACKSKMLRKEIYALDETPLEPVPYAVEQNNCLIQLVQPTGGNRFASFMVLNSEKISYEYERDLTDPRVMHSFILEADVFGNIKKTVALAYQRKVAAFPEQDTVYTTYSEIDYTNSINTNGHYRTPQPFQTKLFEITGLSAPAGDYYSLQEMKAACAAAALLDYHLQPNGTPQKRLVNWQRIQFKADDGVTLLPFGTVSAQSLTHQAFKAAFTQAHLTNVFSAKISFANLNALLLDPAKGGYVFADNYFWAPSAIIEYDVANFFLATGYRDAFGNLTTVAYDNTYHLFVDQITDATGHGSTVTMFNYRVLQPCEIKDKNDNFTAARFDELNFPTSFFAIGKKGVDPGDQFDDTTVEASANDFPSLFVEYHVDEWHQQTLAPGFDINDYKPQPNFTHATIRETHYNADPLHQTLLQETYSYFDGNGSTVLRKVQAEPGLALQVNPDGTVTEIDTTPNLRWVGNGRTILNNKGNAVKQYEPYFSVLPAFDDEEEMVELGVTTIKHYDPVDRAVRIDYPNKTFKRIEYGAWEQRSFDANDTVLESGWYSDRILNPDPAVATPEEIDAAQKAFQHNDTPTVAYVDTLGRVFMVDADNVTETISSRYVLDIEGKQLQVTDALGRMAMQYEHDLMSRAIRQLNLDAGERWMIMDCASKPLMNWDERDRAFSFEYDVLQRPVRSFVSIANAAAVLHAKVDYGESLPPATAIANNLLGKTYRSFDQSGILTSIQNDFKGNLLSGSKQLLTDYQNLIDWTNEAAVALEPEVFTSSTEYDVMNRPVKIITPHTPAMQPSEVHPGYNEAGLPESVEVRIRGAAALTPFITNINYNAKGQREEVTYQNGAKTFYTYDKNTFRLINLRTTRLQAPTLLQDLRYTYDPVGNLTRIIDASQADIFFDGEQVKALNDYEYDAIYRLITAAGRKHAGQTDVQAKPALQHNGRFSNHPFINSNVIDPNDANAFRNYTENYVYDRAGNMKQQQHVSKNSSWTRTFEHDNNNDQNNRLTRSSIGGDDYDYTYDAHGNMHGLETVLDEVWDFMDHFKEADLGGGGQAYYVYDSKGDRVRKVIERQTGEKLERIYLGGIIEIYRERNGAGVITLERETLHVMDGATRIAMVDTPTIIPAGSAEIELVRFQHDNHQGSSALELDNNANIISVEEYFPFGLTSYSTIDATREVPARRYRYTGKERDEETGLNYHGARYYALWLCRWTAADPIGIADGLNVYAYTKNNPVGHVDPAGTNGEVCDPNAWEDEGEGVCTMEDDMCYDDSLDEYSDPNGVCEDTSYTEAPTEPPDSKSDPDVYVADAPAPPPLDPPAEESETPWYAYLLLGPLALSGCSSDSPPPPPPAPAFTPETITGDRVIIAGATSVNDSEGHDKSGWNFLNASANRAKDIKKKDSTAKVTVIMYSPEDLGYQKRGHTEKKGKTYYEDVMKKSAAKYGYQLIIIRKGDQLTPTLKTAGAGQVKQLEYFGHSNADSFLLEYSSSIDKHSTDMWKKSEVAGVPATIFAPNAKANLYGCTLGADNGMAAEMHRKWGVTATGSADKTDYESVVGDDWKPNTKPGSPYREVK